MLSVLRAAVSVDFGVLMLGVPTICAVVPARPPDLPHSLIYSLSLSVSGSVPLSLTRSFPVSRTDTLLAPSLFVGHHGSARPLYTKKYNHRQTNGFPLGRALVFAVC